MNVAKCGERNSENCVIGSVIGSRIFKKILRNWNAKSRNRRNSFDEIEEEERGRITFKISGHARDLRKQRNDFKKGKIE